MQVPQAVRPTLLIAACFASSCNSSSEEAVTRPDVVMIVADTLRSDRLGCYGYPRETSPVIDSLAESGVLFEDNTCQWPWTLPSTVTLFQGRYITGYRDYLSEEQPSIVELFKDEGYTTIGLVANCAVDGNQGFTRGFDHYDVSDCWENEVARIRNDRDILEIRELMLPLVTEALAKGPDGERPPLFLYIHAFDPHQPYLEHEDLNSVLPLTQTVSVEPADFWITTLAARGRPAPEGRNFGWVPELIGLRNGRGRYDQEVRYFDTGLGLILDDLKRLGINQDSVYALVSDHGEGLWDHVSNANAGQLQRKFPIDFFYQSHGGNGYQNVMATPFVMWGHGLPSGQRVQEPVENIDLIPTLLDIANIPAPEGLDGRSLLELLDGEPSEPWREYVYCYGSHTISIRHAPSGYKVILPNGEYSERTGREVELYNIREDPHERINLIDREPDQATRLVQQFATWMEENPAELIVPGSADAADESRRQMLAHKLSAMGYTELDTGISTK